MRRVLAVIAVLVALAAATFAVRTGGRLVLAARVLDELRRPGPESGLRRSTPEPVVSAIALESGGLRFAADLYRPASGRFAAPVLFVPGMVPEGKDESRVAPFARLLARAGFRVIVPSLPSFQSLRVDPAGERELGAAFDAIVARHDLAPRGRCGIFAVSYAGGIAVLAALDPARARRVAFVASVGGFADLERSLTFLATGRSPYRGHTHVLRPSPYGQLVFLRTFEEFLRDWSDRALLEAMAARRMAHPSAPLDDLAARLGPAGRPIFDLFENAYPDEVPALIARLPEELRRRMAELSPERCDFSTLHAPLYLVHARDDDSFPVEESVRLAARARPHTRVRLVVLESLHHVDPEPWSRDPRAFLTRDLPEALRLLGWWSDLLGERLPP